MKKILSVVLLLALALSFIGCGNSKIVGTYKYENGDVLVIKSDHAAVYYGDDYVSDIEWAKTESTIYFTIGLKKYARAAIIDGGLVLNKYNTQYYPDDYSKNNLFFEKIA